MYSGYDSTDLFVFGQKTAITKSTVTKTVCVSLIQINLHVYLQGNDNDNRERG